MGMDGIELILSIEDSFQITIEDAEASALVTVGQLCDLVIGKLEGQTEAGCLNMVAFYRLRQLLITLTGWKRHDIRPSTTLMSILPPAKRIAAWVCLEETTGFKLPQLQHPGYIYTAFGILLLFTAGLILTFVYIYKISLAWLFAGLFINCWALYFFMQVTPGLATVLSTRSAELGSLTKDIVAINHAKVAAQAHGWSEAEVRISVCRLIGLQLGIKVEAIKPDCSFMDDLGMN